MHGSFQLTHMSRDDHAVKFERAMAAKTKTKHYYGAHNVATRVGFGTAKDSHHVWSESLWALRKSCTGNKRRRERSSNGGRQGDKSACISTTEVIFSLIIIRLCHCVIAITTV